MVLLFVDTPEETIHQRLLANRAAKHRRDVTDDVMATHIDSFEPPEEDEQVVRVGVESSPLDMKGLAAVVRRCLGQSR